MPTPVGHSLGGMLLLKIRAPEMFTWKGLLFCVFFANAADLDFVAGFLLNAPNRFHHGISHSFGMAAAVGFCLTLLMLALKKKGAVYMGLSAAAFYSTHIFMDFFSLDSSIPYGVPCFWPLTDRYFISPFSLFTDVRRGSTNAGFLSGFFSLHNFYAVFREIVVVMVFYIVFKKLRGLPIFRKC